MNIFPLERKDSFPCSRESARVQCDKHVIKMPTESGQMLSTAYRMLDGILETRPSKSGKRMVKYWRMENGLEDVLYKAVHMGHPCTVWTMETDSNYMWHLEHFKALCEEYTFRYGKTHGAAKLYNSLSKLPKNIPTGPLTKLPLAMKSNPECMLDDVVESYRAYYQTKSDRFKMVWTRRKKPEWFSINNIEDLECL